MSRSQVTTYRRPTHRPHSQDSPEGWRRSLRPGDGRRLRDPPPPHPNNTARGNRERGPQQSSGLSGGWEANPRWGSQMGGGGIINRRRDFYKGGNGERGPHPKHKFLNSDAVTRGFKQPHGMDLDLVYRAEHRCQSSWASAGAFPKPPRGRLEPGIGLSGHTTPPKPKTNKNLFHGIGVNFGGRVGQHLGAMFLPRALWAPWG